MAARAPVIIIVGGTTTTSSLELRRHYLVVSMRILQRLVVVLADSVFIFAALYHSVEAAEACGQHSRCVFRAPQAHKNIGRKLISVISIPDVACLGVGEPSPAAVSVNMVVRFEFQKQRISVVVWRMEIWAALAVFSQPLNGKPHGGYRLVRKYNYVSVCNGAGKGPSGLHLHQLWFASRLLRLLEAPHRHDLPRHLEREPTRLEK